MSPSDERGPSPRALLTSAFALVLVVFLAWRLGGVILLLSAAILFGVFLDGLARMLSSRLPVKREIALFPVVIVLFAVTVVTALFIGPRIAEQLDALIGSLRGALETLIKAARENTLGERLLAAMPEEPAKKILGDGKAMAKMLGAAGGAFSALTSVALVLLVGAYLSLQPKIYTRGLEKLLPARRRARYRQVLAASGHVLRRWLVGRAASMAVVGLLTWLGLAILGVPVAASLGLVAGLLSFVPFLGPALSLGPALLIGLADGGPLMGLWVLGLFAIIQALETALVTPQIEKMAVSLPPAFLIAVQLAFGAIAGVPGVVMATPLAVVIVVLVQMLYVEDVLGEPVTILAEGSGPPA